MPFWLSIYNSDYGRAAMALNWRVLWLGEGAITGIVAEVSEFLQDFLLTSTCIIYVPHSL